MKVHVELAPITIVAGDHIERLLENAGHAVMETIEEFGDGLIPHGWFEYADEANRWVTVSNANNHQTTWSVLARALAAVMDFMRRHEWGSTTFQIFDGVNQVGEGQIG